MWVYTVLPLLGVGAVLAMLGVFDDDDNDTGEANPGVTETGTTGNDTLTGGTGDDTLLGEAGSDLLLGNEGDDYLRGGDGDDAAAGGEGDDRIILDDPLSESANGGSDVGIGGAGDDVLRGGIETDVLSGGEGDDLVVGDRGADWLQGDAGDDQLEGRVGNDTLIGGAGQDTLEGGSGKDALFGGEALRTPLGELDIAPAWDDFQNGLPVNFPAQDPIYATDDGEVDVLDGGYGDDTLFLGDGDEGTGGVGNDTFYLIDGVGVDPAIVTDFAQAEDALVYLKGNGEADPTLALVDNGDGTSTLSADGAVVATIRGDVSIADVVIAEAGG